MVHIQGILHGALLSLLARQWHLSSGLLHRGWCSGPAGDEGGLLHGRRIVRRRVGQEGDAAGAVGEQGTRRFGCRRC